jgi:hypothetical protein
MLEKLSNSKLDKSERNKIKFLLGELQRISTKTDKSVSDELAIKVLKKIVKNCNEMINMCDSRYVEEKYASEELIEYINNYLPKEITEEEINSFLDTLDFNKYKNKMQAIGDVMKHFNGNVDGNVVKSLIVKR